MIGSNLLMPFLGQVAGMVREVDFDAVIDYAFRRERIFTDWSNSLGRYNVELFVRIRVRRGSTPNIVIIVKALNRALPIRQTEIIPTCMSTWVVSGSGVAVGGKAHSTFVLRLNDLWFTRNQFLRLKRPDNHFSTLFTHTWTFFTHKQTNQSLSDFPHTWINRPNIFLLRLRVNETTNHLIAFTRKRKDEKHL